MSRGESLHQQVARNIRNQIAAGLLRHGQPLPSTRDLAQQWDVSVFTINEAMKLLAGENVIVSRPRVGRVVNAPDQAARVEVRTESPRVLLVGGYAGSGKTELGRVLARETGWPMLDKDTLTRPVVEAALEVLGLSPHDRESEGYLSRIRPREYEALINAMTENVQCGNSAIVTAPFIREFKDAAWLDRLEASCIDMGAKVSVVWVYCDADTMHTYIRHRGAARDAFKLDNWESYVASLDTEFRPPVPHFTVNNSASGAPLQTQARELVSRMLAEG
ncbi:DNA-binding transcriptional regulator YhcF (GntR family)/predicted kinase [Saccharothrix coeruleofusca]|uniref:GntR family transcriptional regulator n=1 Tax=Saccharothrix coeruleofusca TaxID=33919 RepID=UPI0027DD3766|nr:GntR family transcriptional regulator [Saccharothrix coeruleofusca]MBP2340209.1 DNA-binding transcriptional regulator YhcF (GntR family)/predicted kinase [Saccharothrix coeruleofusca]